MKRFKAVKYISIIALLLLTIFSAKAQSFRAKELTIVNANDSTVLNGTLTTPANGSAKAVLVLATGSGMQNRDEELSGQRPFKVIAEYLSSNGYAVLRVDDRGYGVENYDFTHNTINDFASDIAACTDAIRTQFKSTPIGVLGHSEGGTIAIKNATSNPNCNFIITLGAPAWSGDSIIMSQSRALAVGLTGKWDGEEHQRKILDIVKSDLSNMQAHIALNFLLRQIYGEQAALPEAEKALAQQVDILVSRWYRQLVRYNPANDIRNVSKPWLALNGERDTQVLPGNLATIKELNPKVETIELPAHNHLFQPCATGLANEYQTLTQSPSAQTLETILNWLNTIVPSISVN